MRRTAVGGDLTLFLFLSCSMLQLVIVNGDLSHMFTALAHMSGLVEVEGELLGRLEDYIAAEERRLEKLKTFAQTARQVQNMAQDDPRGHILHPTNAMALILRYYNMWGNGINELTKATDATGLVDTIESYKDRFPTEDDFSGAVTALTRLQDTYLITPRNLTQGHLGSVSAVSLTCKDCFDIGRMAYQEKDWWYTGQWMMEALRKFDEKNDTKEVQLVDIYDHLAFAEYELGNLRRASQFTKELLQNEPGHERAKKNLVFYEQELKEHPDKHSTLESNNRVRNISVEMQNYEEFCREGRPVPRDQHHKLMCFYYTKSKDPQLILRPAKIEIVYLKPKIFVLRGLVSQTEILRLQELGGPKLNRATVYDSNQKIVYSSIRTSKSAWLDEHEDNQGHLSRINRRMEAITNLDLSTAELLQVCNYGIGGHYNPHYDYSTETRDIHPGEGRRIATVLIYLTDVTLGGCTVFTSAGAQLKPSEGDAAFWWNLKRSGEGDLRTRHAACPVLVGSKWVCNKWIHERGQEFRRRCALSPKK